MVFTFFFVHIFAISMFISELLNLYYSLLVVILISKSLRNLTSRIVIDNNNKVNLIKNCIHQIYINLKDFKMQSFPMTNKITFQSKDKVLAKIKNPELLNKKTFSNYIIVNLKNKLIIFDSQTATSKKIHP